MGDGSASVSESTSRDVGAILAGQPVPRLSRYAEAIQGSTILKIAAEIREMLARGESVLNLTVGDFRPDQFPVPEAYRRRIAQALEEGETNYPPTNGVAELREALVELTRDDLGLEYPAGCFLVAGGARPLLYSAYMTLVDPGDTVVYPVPSWNNHHYVQMAGAHGVPLPVRAEKNFHPDADEIRPHLRTARMIALNTPLNPTGTCISRDALTGLCQEVVAENRRREASGERGLYLLFDQVYNTLTFGDVEHFTPVGLVPEVAPYTLLLDAVSKGLCGTGLRVGWAAGPEPIIRKMTALSGHYGSWAPRPEQVATGRFLRDRAALQAHRTWMTSAVEMRLDALHRGFTEMREAGLPVTHIEPQGAIYLSVRFDLQGRTVGGRLVQDDEALRQALLLGAGFAVVPFDAFGFAGEPGWMRISVGAVSLADIGSGLERVRALLESAE
jgi:aspartate aminotransferase